MKWEKGCLWLEATNTPYSRQHRLGSWDFKIVIKNSTIVTRDPYTPAQSSLLGSLTWMLTYMTCNPFRMNITCL